VKPSTEPVWPDDQNQCNNPQNQLPPISSQLIKWMPGIKLFFQGLKQKTHLSGLLVFADHISARFFTKLRKILQTIP